jgi:hypothetical protein
MVAYEVLEIAKLQVLQSISPSEVERYISNMIDFELGYQDDDVIIYYKKDSKYDQITIPRKQEFKDYIISLSDTIKDIAHYQKRSVKQIINILGLKRPVDILRYKMEGSSAEDGTLSLEEGAKLYSGAIKTILASASYTDKPGKKYYSKTNYPSTRELISLCRIGQTELGSYSVPLYCPIYTKNKKKEIQILGWGDNPKASKAHSLNRIVKVKGVLKRSPHQNRLEFMSRDLLQ